jgi:DNA-binding NarL/FixJ family response regulator
MSSFRVLVADDDESVRMGICKILELRGSLEICGQAATGGEAIAIGVLAKQGALEESVWPYKAGEFAAKPPAGVDKATRWLIAQTKSLKGLDEIKSALADDGPVVVGIEVYREAMSSQTAKTGAIPLPRLATGWRSRDRSRRLRRTKEAIQVRQ